MHPDWARSLRDQCVAAGVPFHFKQWGQYRPVPIFEDQSMSSGRAINDPRGGRVAMVIRERAPEKNHFRGSQFRPMAPGDVNGLGVMLDHDWFAVKLGKAEAGRELDGRIWDEYPQPVTADA